MKYLIGIVSYNPDEKNLKQTIYFLKKNDYHVLIVDNGSKNFDVVEKICNKYGVDLVANNANFGIAKALNEIFSFAKENGFLWVLTFDQDSKINKSLLEAYEACRNIKNVGMYCPIVYDYVSGMIVQGKKSLNHYRQIDKCITSGALTSVEAWSAVNGFDEYLFIDEVDNDFCYRLKLKNYKILLIGNVTLNHKIGRSRIINFLGKKMVIRNHSAMRKYYITRNRLYLDKKYYNKIKIKTMIKTILFIIKTLIFEKNRTKKFNACIKGMKDAIR